MSERTSDEAAPLGARWAALPWHLAAVPAGASAAAPQWSVSLSSFSLELCLGLERQRQ